MSNPTILDLVNVIFMKLSLTYGRDFLSRYEGLNLEDVKADWAYELAGCEKNPSAVKWALNCLPESKPPNVYEFRAIVRRAPEKNVPALDTPPSSKSIRDTELKKCWDLVKHLRPEANKAP